VPLDEDVLGDAPIAQRVDQVLSEEVGDDLAEMLGRARHAQEELFAQNHPDESLRERKRRLTRQRISDVATTMFAARGFDQVKVSDVAEIVGVSEKTVYNYFPTKESMILDQADEMVDRLARALRERRSGEPLSTVVVDALKQEMQQFDVIPDELVTLFPRFRELLESTPSLRAAWLDLNNRLVAVARDELAARAEVDPRDPEPMITAQALVGLGQVAFDARIRYIEQGLRGAELRDAVINDLERAARLLETGLWSFNLLAQGRRTREQLLEAAQAAELARQQVVKALREARRAWKRHR
jgi:AcrR family transcriptional regulator